MCSRLWSLERRYFLGGLQQLFKQLDNFNPQEAQRVLPLHSSPVLARIVHDLGAPLQVVAFCAEQIVEDPTRAQNPRYVEQLQ